MKHYKIVNDSILQEGGGGLTVLTYNVSWEAMTSNTSGNFKLCKENTLGDGLCKTNILDNISSNIKKYSPDFACFQEAAEHNDIVDLFDKNIYKNFVNMSGKETMLTLWNYKKFDLVKSYYGNFEEGRPFAIIILLNKKTKKNFALINIHAAHRINSQSSIFDVINNFIKTNIGYTIKKSVNRVLMVGDFNRDVFEDETSDYNIKFIDTFELKKISNNKATCCSILGYGHKYNYDHVLDSKGVVSKKILANTVKTYKYPASDHILVITKLN
jgi:hypothetical protein